MARYIDADKSVGIGYLSDWYQNSIDDTKPPIWTDEHLEELTNDFIVIPKDTPTADVAEVKHGKWIYNTDDFSPKTRCSVCGYNKPLAAGEYIKQEPSDYCNKCGAKMDE